MNRFGLSRSGLKRPPVGCRRGGAYAEEQSATPHAGDTLFEIGVILALHLAFALAVLVTLDAFGVR